MIVYQIKHLGPKEVEVTRDGSRIGTLQRNRWANVSGQIDGHGMDMRMSLGLTGLRWKLKVDGGPQIAVRPGRILGVIPTGNIYHLDIDGTTYVLSRPHRDAFEWPLDRGDERLGYLAVSIGWTYGNPLSLDVELNEALPAWMSGVVGYLACRAFVDSAHPRRADLGGRDNYR